MRLLFLIFLISAFSICGAQNKPFEYSLGWKGGGNGNPIHVKTISNDSGDLHGIVVNNNDQLKMLWFNDSLQMVKESQLVKMDGETVLGGYLKSDKAFLLLKSDKSDNVRSLVFNMQGDGIQDYTLTMDLQGKKYLGKMNAGERFLFITADKKEPVISVFSFESGDRVDKLDFNLGSENLKTGFSKNDLWKALSRSSGFSRSVDAAIVHPDIECDVDVANSPNKLYARGDSLVLVMDREPLKTQVFAMGLKDRGLSYSVIGRNLNSDQKGEDLSSSKFNSFLLGDNLYYVLASQDKLTVSVCSFSTHNELSRFESLAGAGIDFKNTPIMQEGGGTIFSQKVERELDKTKQLLRKMMAGRAVITAIHTSPAADELTIGAFKEITARSGGFMPGFGAMGGVAVGVPIGSGIYMAPGYSASWNRITRFKMLVDRTSGKQIPGKVSPSVNEQIEEYSKDVKIPAGGSSLFKTGESFRYAYYDRDEKKLVVVTFK